MEPTLKPPAIEPAELSWRDGVPESLRFGDVYFSRDNGLEETRHVFLQHNGLPERFARVPAGGQFVIAENGFGTGLNFLAAWQAWREHRPSETATLHFVSVERFPLTRTDLARALALWPELKTLAEALLAVYPPLVRGVHRLVLDGGAVRLTLFFGDIRDAWRSLDFRADAWFLDGFAPARNPDMWLDDTIGQIRRHSRAGTTLATFTSVGRVRRAFIDAGFRMEKAPGYGRKREMLKGILDGGPSEGPARPDRVVIIGAGIAGCTLARNLAERGQAVTLVDSEGPGAAASGNAQGALYVKLGVEFNDQTELALSALTFAQRYYQRFGGDAWHATGLLQLGYDDKETSRQARFLERNDYPTEILQPVSREQAAELCGVSTETGGLWFPASGWLEPGRLCRALVDHPLITGHWQRRATGLARPAEGSERWQLMFEDGTTLQADQVVVCAGHLTPSLLPVTVPLRLKAIRGQVTHLPESLVQAPRAVLCGNRYLNPALGAFALTGATFDLRDDNPQPTANSNRENLTELQAMLPSAFSPQSGAELDPAGLQARVAFRCTTHDYQPVAGPLCTDPDGRLAGLTLFTGLGSKGLSYAPLLAEYLADRLTGQPRCLPLNLVRRLETRRLQRKDVAVS